MCQSKLERIQSGSRIAARQRVIRPLKARHAKPGAVVVLAELLLLLLLSVDDVVVVGVVCLCRTIGRRFSQNGRIRSRVGG